MKGKTCSSDLYMEQHIS